MPKNKFILKNSAPPKTNFIFSAKNGKKPQDRCIKELPDDDETYIYKLSNYSWFHYKRDDLIKFIDECIDTNIHYPIYEVLTRDMKVPLYLDIEYESGCNRDLKPLTDYIKILESKIKDIGVYTYDIDINNFACTNATRLVETETKKYYKHSYHLILRKPPLYFENKFSLKNFLANIDFELKSVKNNFDTTNIFRSKISSSELSSIPDLAVYGSNQAMRAINSYKNRENNGSCILRKFGLAYETKNYFITYVPSDSYKVHVNCPDIKHQAIAKHHKILVPIPREVPQAILKQADKLIKQLQPGATGPRIEILPDGSIFFNYLDNKNPCYIHNRIHSHETGRTHWLLYSANSNEFFFACKKSGQFETIKMENNLGLLTPDYNYEDRDEIDCKPLPHPDSLKGVGSTFLEEAQKGCGKTKAMSEFLGTVPDKKILIISYRQNLCDKYAHELKDHNFSHYKDFNMTKPPSQEQLNRCIICLNSICKTFQFKNDFNVYVKKYDIIIIDEIFSLMEYWSCQNFGAALNSIMLSFEYHIKRCDYLYLLDAHLNHKLVIEPLISLRDKNKITFYKNPKAHDYSDYTINWYEPNSDKNMINYFNSLQEEDLKNGKKIAVMSSTKDYVEKRDLYIQELQRIKSLPDFIINTYHSNQNQAVMREHFSDISIPWGDPKCKLVMYSPTISAGINFNDLGEETGFDKFYAYIKIGHNLPSLNTIIQMLNRIRQLKDKEINIFFDTTHNSQIPLSEYSFEKDLENRSKQLYTYCSVPMKGPTQLSEEDFSPIYDKKDWSYRVWYHTAKAKIKYSQYHNFKDALISELTNKPDDLIKSGRGMTLNDQSKTSLVDDKKLSEYELAEKSEKEIQQLKLENIYDDTMSLKNPLQEYLDNLENADIISDKDRMRINISRIQRLYKINLDSHRDIVYLKKTNQEYDVDKYKSNMELWFKLNTPLTKSIFRRQKMWINHSFHKYINQTYDAFIEDNKELNPWYITDQSSGFISKTRPQVYEALWKKQMPKLLACELICEFLDIPIGEDINGHIIVKDSINIAGFKKFWLEEIQPRLGQTKYNSKYIQNFELMRHVVQIWSHKNPGISIQDVIKLDYLPTFLENNKIDKCILKAVAKNWENQDPKKQDGKWECPYWNTIDPDMWSPVKIINTCFNELKNTIGYDKRICEVCPRNKTIISYEVFDVFEYLKEIKM